MLIEEVKQCAFSRWFPLLGHLSIESEIIKIDEKFVNYILQDGIILPECCNSEPAPTLVVNGINQQDDDDDDFGIDDDDGNNEDGDKEAVIIEFPEIEKQMRKCLKKFTAVFPKLNWSSCEDSYWIQSNGTKCTNLTGIFLLLKSSEKIVHDLVEPFEHCCDYDPPYTPKVEYELILRKWINMNPSMEFRCFIANGRIIGISQRDVRAYYDYIGKEKSDIIKDIQDFYHKEISGKFPLSKFVIDVLRPQAKTIVLIDVNVFGRLTDSLLFDWDELETISEQSSNQTDTDNQLIDFRFIEDRLGIQRSRFEQNSLPLDVFNGYISDIFAEQEINQ